MTSQDCIESTDPGTWHSMDNSKDGTTPDPAELSLNGTPDFKSLTDVTGGHGPWQFRHWLVFLLATFFNVLHLFSVSLLFHEQCLFKEDLDGTSNNSTSSSRNANESLIIKKENCSESACWNSSVKSWNLSVQYHSENFNVLIHQCSSMWIVPYAKCIYVIGCVLSLTLVRPLTLRYGRRPVSLVSCAVWMMSSLATAFAHVPTVYLVLRFIATLGIVTVYVISLMSLAECLCQEYKYLYIICGNLGWGVGHFFLPLFLWTTGGWLGFHVILCIGSLLMLALFCFLPESAIYYAKRGLWSSANKTLKIAAISNGYSPTRLESFTHNWMLLQEKGPVERRSFQIRNYLQVLKLVILFFSSFMTTFIYLIYTYRADWIKGRIGSNFALMGTSEVAAVIILLFATTMVPLKYLWALSSTIASILLFITYSKLHSGERTTIPRFLYLATIFFASSSWILLLLKSMCTFCAASKWSKLVLCTAVCIGAFAASSMEFKDQVQSWSYKPILIWAVPHFFIGISTILLET